MLPPLTCANPVKLRPAWDRSCTRKISNACVGEPLDSFSIWSAKASGLRPSVLRSTVTRKGQQQAREQTPDEGPDADEATPSTIFRQHLLQQVKVKLGASERAKPRFSVKDLVEAKPDTVSRSKGASDVRKVDSQIDAQVDERVVPAKIHTRPKGPEFPGARRGKVQSATEIEQNRHGSKAEESDGIFDDDGSSCDSDF